MDAPEPATPTPLYCNAFRTLKRRAENGRELTIAEIEDAVEADPVARKAFADIAAEIRSGRDVTVAEVAQRARMPVEFVALCVTALVGQFTIGFDKTRVN